jgi:hypothetical protein
MEEAVMPPVPEKWPWLAAMVVGVVLVITVVANRYEVRAHWGSGGFEVAPAQLPPAAMPPH